MKWMVFDYNMNFLGTISAENYTEAFMVAQNRWKNVDYIQQC